MAYKVKLEIFEGPLDLLLYLIKRDEVNIYDIPIAKITEEYLEYLHLMQMLDLGIAGEFLVMAATLVHIKSKMLLPPEEREPEEVEELDPREELVKRLLEYKKFKEAADRLADYEEKRKDIFVRHIDPSLIEEGEAPQYFEASLFDLISAFSKVLKEVPKEAFYELIKDQITVEEKVHNILHTLVERTRLLVSELFEMAKNKLEIVVTFLAILELIKQKEILVRQRQLFGEIEIIRNAQKITPKIV